MLNADPEARGVHNSLVLQFGGWVFGFSPGTEREEWRKPHLVELETATRSPDSTALVLAHLAPQPSINQRECSEPNVA